MSPENEILIQMSQTLGEVKGAQEAHGDQLDKIWGRLSELPCTAHETSIVIMEEKAASVANRNSILVASGLVAAWEGIRYFFFGK